MKQIYADWTCDVDCARFSSRKKRYDIRAAVFNWLMLSRTFKSARIAIFMITLTGGVALFAGPDDGLLALYPLNGNGADMSSGGHDGFVSSAVPTANRFGQDEKALLFDGTNSFVAVGDSSDLRLANTDFTIAAWIFETDRNPNYQDCIISKRGSGPGVGKPDDGRGWFFSVRGLREGVGNPGHLVYQVSGGQDPRALSTQTLSLNQWHHVGVVYHHASGTAELFIDGQWDSTTEGIPAPNPSTIAEMHIGNDSQLAYNNAYVFHGKISNLRIYGRALAQTEMTALYGAGLFINSTHFTGKTFDRVYGGLIPGQRVLVESSSDLAHWTPVETNQVNSAFFSLTHSVDPTVQMQFFRVSVP